MSNPWDISRPPKQPKRPQGRRLKPELLSEYVDWTEFVHRHRFASADQVARFYNVKIDKARYRLRQMRAHGYLQVLPVRGGVSDDEHMHFVTSRGLTFVRDERELEGKTFDGAREDSRAAGKLQITAEHERLLTETQMRLELEILRLGGEVLFTERRWRQPGKELSYPEQGKPKAFHPDLGILFKIGEVKYPLTFVEFEASDKAEEKLQAKLENYSLWFETPEAKQYLADFHQSYGFKPAPFCWVLFVAHRGHRTSAKAEEVRVLKLLDKAVKLPESFRKFVWLAEAESFATFPLTEPFWLRPLDVHDPDAHRHALVKS